MGTDMTAKLYQAFIDSQVALKEAKAQLKALREQSLKAGDAARWATKGGVQEKLAAIQKAQAPFTEQIALAEQKVTSLQAQSDKDWEDYEAERLRPSVSLVLPTETRCILCNQVANLDPLFLVCPECWKGQYDTEYLAELRDQVIAQRLRPPVVLVLPTETRCILCNHVSEELDPLFLVCPECWKVQYHTRECLATLRDQTIAFRLFMERHPHACLSCEVTGMVHTPDTDIPGGDDPCQHCSELGLCPLCGQPGLTSEARGDDSTGEGPCTFCGFNYGKEKNPQYMPVIVDWCPCHAREMQKYEQELAAHYAGY